MPTSPDTAPAANDAMPPLYARMTLARKNRLAIERRQRQRQILADHARMQAAWARRGAVNRLPVGLVGLLAIGLAALVLL